MSFHGNKISTIDLSVNINLTNLGCGDNLLTNIDLSTNTALLGFSCIKNQLTSLDVSNNTSLSQLYCYENKLTHLDLSKNSALTYMFCQNNQLTCLNVKNGNNQNLLYCMASSNPDLTCFEVDDTAWATAKWAIDPQTSFTTNCDNDCSTTGIRDITYKTIRAYPNPFSASTTIEFPNYSGDNHTLNVYDMLGNRVRQVENITSDKVIVTKDDLNRGVYFLELSSATQAFKGRFIIE